MTTVGEAWASFRFFSANREEFLQFPPDRFSGMLLVGHAAGHHLSLLKPGLAPRDFRSAPGVCSQSQSDQQTSRLRLPMSFVYLVLLWPL